MLIKKKMMIKRIYNNPEVYYGLGAISCLKSLEFNNFLILLSNSVKNTEEYTKLRDGLKEKTIQEEIIPNATQELILSLRTKYISSKFSCLIAIGGGKVLDVAKVLRVLLDYPSITFPDFEKSNFYDQNQTKLIAIPTTPGTGSETNAIAVIKMSDGRKMPLINSGFVPDLAVLDHKFLNYISEQSMFEFGADIFSHGFEGQVSMASSSMLKSLGESCLNLLKNGFKQFKENSKEAKGHADILYSGHLGGIVQGNAYVGVVHALAHTLEEQIPISHGGSILAVLKPTLSWMKNTLNKPEYEEYLKIYDAIGFEKYRNPSLLQNINIDKWADAALKDPSISTTPIRMKKENLMELINWILTNK